MITFNFHGKVTFRSCVIRFLIFQTIPSISKVVTSWWLFAHEVENYFENISWIVNRLLVLKLSELIDIVMDNVIKECFAWFGGPDPKSRQSKIVNIY